MGRNLPAMIGCVAMAALSGYVNVFIYSNLMGGGPHGYIKTGYDGYQVLGHVLVAFIAAAVLIAALARLEQLRRDAARYRRALQGDDPFLVSSGCMVWS